MSKTKTLRCFLALMLSAALTLGAISVQAAAQDGQGGDIVVGNPTNDPVDPPTDGPVDPPTNDPVDPPAPVAPATPVAAPAQAPAMLGGVQPTGVGPQTIDLSTLTTDVLTIDDGENVTLTGENTGVAITCYAASLTLSGATVKSLEFTQNATLTITGTNTLSGSDGVGLSSDGVLTVQESGTGSLTVTVGESSTSTAISVVSLVLQSGTVTATGGNSTSGTGGNGVFANGGSVTVNGGSLTATGGNGTYGGIGLSANGVTVTNGSLTANGGIGGNGLSAGSVTVSGGTLEANGGDGTSRSGGDGVYAVSVTVSGAGQLTGQGGDSTSGGGDGVTVGSNIILNSGTLTGTGGNGSGSHDDGWGVAANSSIRVNGGILTGIAGNARGNGVGVATGNDNITVASGAALVATATNSNGIQAGNDTSQGYKVIVSYGGSLTVNGTENPTDLTYVTIQYLAQPVIPDPEPQPQPQPSRPSRSDDDDSGSGGSSVPASTGTTTSANVGLGGTVSPGQIQSEAYAALKAAEGTRAAAIRTQNASSISPETLVSLAQQAEKAGKTLTLHADTVENGAVVGRLYVEPAKLTGRSEDLKLGVYTQPARTAPVTQMFERYFENTVRVVALEQQGSFGTALRIAAKVDLAGLDTKTLMFYSYDAKTNTYRRIDHAAYWIDSKGYLHFYTQLAGSIVITDKPLTLKK